MPILAISLAIAETPAIQTSYLSTVIACALCHGQTINREVSGAKI